MRSNPFLLAAVLALAFAVSSEAAEKPRAAQSNQSQSKKIWTNEDMDGLRARGLISIVGQDSSAAAVTAAVSASPAPIFPSYDSRLESPQWYAQKAADLQAELAAREAALHAQRMALALAADRITQPGIAMDRKNAGVTPLAGIAILEAQVTEVQNELNDLSDLARQNNIPAGILRG